MASMRAAAEESYNGKLDRMGLRTQTATTGPKGRGQQRSMEDGSDGRASGGRAEGYATEAENEATLDDKAPKKLRLDRPAFKNGGAVKKGATVNVIVAPQVPPSGPPPMPPPEAMMKPPMPPGPPPAPPPGAMPPGGGPPMGGAPMARKHGGRVQKMDAGAGGGKGRLEKIKAYGDRAKPGGKAGTF